MPLYKLSKFKDRRNDTKKILSNKFSVLRMKIWFPNSSSNSLLWCQARSLILLCREAETPGLCEYTQRSTVGMKSPGVHWDGQWCFLVPSPHPPKSKNKIKQTNKHKSISGVPPFSRTTRLHSSHPNFATEPWQSPRSAMLSKNMNRIHVFPPSTLMYLLCQWLIYCHNSFQCDFSGLYDLGRLFYLPTKVII